MMPEFLSYTERQVRTVRLVRKTGRVAMDGLYPKGMESKRAPRSPLNPLKSSMMKKQKRARHAAEYRLIALQYGRAESPQGNP